LNSRSAAGCPHCDVHGGNLELPGADDAQAFLCPAVAAVSAAQRKNRIQALILQRLHNQGA
jgi:hypothetical protein